LVPGDIVSVTGSENTTCPCDLLLLSGSCVVNEAMLTGYAIMNTENLTIKIKK
jgi:P-type E1-E2 ATPase